MASYSHLVKFAEVMARVGLEPDLMQLLTVAETGSNQGWFKGPTKEVDPVKKAESNENRLAIGDWLIANVPPSYTGDTATALTCGQIIQRTGLEINRSTLAITRGLLENSTSRFHEWGPVARVNDRTLYARSARLIEFRPDAVAA